MEQKKFSQVLEELYQDQLMELDFIDFLSSEQLFELSEALQTNTSLKKLGFTGTDFGNEENIKSLVKVLEKNRTIVHLYFDNTLITDEGIRNLIDLLKKNTTIMNFCLMRNSFSLGNIRYFSDMLKFNSTLKVLHFFENKGMNDDSIKFLAESLSDNFTLTSLSLSDVGMTKIGAKYLSELLEKNITLDSLLLIESHPIDNEVCQCFENALEKNITIRNIKFLDEKALKLLPVDSPFVLINNSISRSLNSNKDISLATFLVAFDFSLLLSKQNKENPETLLPIEMLEKIFSWVIYNLLCPLVLEKNKSVVNLEKFTFFAIKKTVDRINKTLTNDSIEHEKTVDLKPF